MWHPAYAFEVDFVIYCSAEALPATSIAPIQVLPSISYIGGSAAVGDGELVSLQELLEALGPAPRSSTSSRSSIRAPVGSETVLGKHPWLTKFVAERDKPADADFDDVPEDISALSKR